LFDTHSAQREGWRVTACRPSATAYSVQALQCFPPHREAITSIATCAVYDVATTVLLNILMLIKIKKQIEFGEISGSHSGEYED
jgi:hypothetical protein